jgi:cytochrome c
MKSVSRCTAFAAFLVPMVASMVMAPAVSRAATPEAIAAGAGCSACHSVDKKILGPAYRDIAARYKGNPKAAGVLAAKVRSGGSGVWGPVPMPAADAAKISDADLSTVIGWILKQ